MANENIKSASLAEGIAFMEKCLDTMLSEQRKAAHHAIDMDDWNKAEEILAATKKNIVQIESLKSKFSDFKAEAVNLGFVSDSVSADNDKAEPAAESKPAKQPETAESKPAPKPAEQPKPVEQPKPADQPKPSEQPKPAHKPAEQSAPAPKAVERPKQAEQPKPVEQPKPAPKSAEQPKPAPKSAEQPKPEGKREEAPVRPGSEARNEILDMEMTDIDDTPDTAAPVIAACEALITKFPFSMRLIYSNPKIGKFFTADEVIAENDMSKPKQLSNGLWVETNIPEEKVQTFIRGLTRYCEESVNM